MKFCKVSGDLAWHINIDLVHFIFSPENYATFARSWNSDFIVRFILVRFVFVTKASRI